MTKLKAFPGRAEPTRSSYLLRLAAVGLGLLSSGAARAEVSEVRFARQLGLGYLQLYVMQEQKLVEKQAARLGLNGLSAKYNAFGNPAAINDAVLTQTADYGAAGVTPFLVLWDKTRTNAGVKAVAALNAQPAFLNTINPDIKSLKDFTAKDRIAVPSVKVSLQAILLQMAAEQTFGTGQQNRLDSLTVSLSHPDGTVALLTGRTEINAHFTSPPFQYQQLQDKRVHRVLSSYDVTGGPASFSVLFATERFRAENPTVYRAVYQALEEATAFIAVNRAESARIFLKIENSKLSQDFIEGLLTDPEITYSTAPQNILKFSDFMARIGTLGTRPARWQDLFFPEIHGQAGS